MEISRLEMSELGCVVSCRKVAIPYLGHLLAPTTTESPSSHLMPPFIGGNIDSSPQERNIKQLLVRL